MKTIPESDWKKLRALKTGVLNLACGRILVAAAQIAEKRDGREHEAYLELWELIKEQDRLIGTMFDDFKRSTAIFKLAFWLRNDLLSESEMSLFSEETQATVKAMLEFR